MARITARVEHNSGIPLGGIGTGSIEVRPDGYFHEWQIFNLGRWAPRQPESCQVEGPAMGPDALAFYVWARRGRGGPIVRRLGMRTDQNDLYSFAWCKGVQAIQFEGAYPLARLKYLDDDLPVEISATVFSPFVPHDSRTSGTPGFHAVFRLANRSKRAVEVSLAATLANPLAWCAADRMLTNTISRSDDATLLTMRTAADAPCKATLGSLSLSVAGGEASWAAGEFAGYCRRGGRLAWTPTGQVRESLLRTLRLTGRLANSDGSQSPAGLLRCGEQDIDALPEEERRRLIDELCRYGLFGDLRRRIEEVDAEFLSRPEGQSAFLKSARAQLNVQAGEDRSRQSWGDGALCGTVRLGPGQTREIRFALGWHFPNHYSANGPVLGHMYEHWFADAEGVCRFLNEHFDEHRATVCTFAETLADTKLPAELPDAWAGQLTTLPKCTWWTKAGDFGVWEGLGCCGFHTTDITYQGSFSILALFPDLQKRQMAMGAAFQRDDGRVHHFFTPDLGAVDNGFDRVDMNQQFVLLVCRDWLWTGDERYLRAMWPHVVKAMDNTAALDADGDGLPDHDTRRNTYDGWDFRGTPSYIASLWVSALLAAGRLADDLGETDRARQWRQMLDRAKASFDKKLWNGRYYSLWVDGEQRDECCMSDQIDGEWFTELIGLGHCLPAGRIRRALRAIFKHNFNVEDGLINAGYPPGTRPLLSTYRNIQAEAPWTGIEYAMASMMLEFGLWQEAAAVVRNIHDRYARAGRLWNHVECGDHYYRAMSSWAVLLSATGFKVDAPRQAVTLAPPGEASRARGPWVSATGWGQFRRTPKRIKLRCHAGSLTFRTLRLNLSARSPAATLDGAELACKPSRAAGLLALEFAEPVTLNAGDVLMVQ